MGNFWKVVNNVIKDSDILIEVIDARFPELTRNEEIERKVKKEGKKLILVYNKLDLVDKKFSNKDVVLSCKTRRGLRLLREKIMIEAKKLNKNPVTVGVLGYPNTGKSSIINTLKGKGSARTSSKSGLTLGVQKVKVNEKIMMLDTPGVIPFGEDEEEKHALIGALNPENLKYPEDTAEFIIKKFPKSISLFYGCVADLEAIAERLNKKKKGNLPDLETTSKLIIRDWQKGKINSY
jgi:ribosome biogenesis GTPase A